MPSKAIVDHTHCNSQKKKVASGSRKIWDGSTLLYVLNDEIC